MRAKLHALRSVEVPRGAILALCTLALALPTGLATAHQLNYDGQGNWVHHHTANYRICNDIDQDSQLRQKANEARDDWWAWNQPPTPEHLRTGVDFVPAQCHPTGAPVANIELMDAYFGDTGWRASTWQQSVTAGHLSHTHVRFNLSNFGSVVNQYHKRTLACREIGRTLGLALASGNEGMDNDCLSFGGNIQQERSRLDYPNNYTYHNQPGLHSRDTLQWGREAHNDAVPPLVTADGPLVSGQNPVVPADFEVNVQATDDLSGVRSVSLAVDGAEIDSLTQACSPGSGPCPFEAVLWPGLTQLAPGPHTYEIVAVDGNGNRSTPVSGQFSIDDDPPELELSGALVDRDGEPIQSGTLNVAVSDNGTYSSGIERLELVLGTTNVLSIQPSCDEGCPSTAEGSYTYTRAEWGPGPHYLTILATDRAGNSSEELIVIDDGGDPEVSCPTDTPTTATGGTVFTRQEAQAEAIPQATQPSQPAFIEELEDTLDPTVVVPDDPSPDDLGVVGSLTEGADRIGAGASDEIVIDNLVCLVPTHTTAAATDGGIVNDSVVYANSAPDTDTIVRPTALGETLIQSVRGAEAPSSFSWKVGLPPDLELRELTTGGVAVVDPSEPPGEGLDPEPVAGPVDPEMIPDVATQYSHALAEWTAATEESDNEVVALLAPPYVIDQAGDVEMTSATVAGSNTVTVQSRPGAQAVVAAWQSQPGKCYKANSLDIPLLGWSHYVTYLNPTRTCIWRTKKRGIRAFLRIYPVIIDQPSHISARLLVTSWLDGKRMARTRQLVNPDIPADGLTWRTRPIRARGRWCAKTRTKTRLANHEIGFMTLFKACARLKPS